MSTRLGDIRIVIRGVDPDLSNRLDAVIDEGQPLLVAYDGGALELMKAGLLHELTAATATHLANPDPETDPWTD